MGSFRAERMGKMKDKKASKGDKVKKALTEEPDDESTGDEPDEELFAYLYSGEDYGEMEHHYDGNRQVITSAKTARRSGNAAA